MRDWSQLDGYEEALAAKLAHLSPRYRELDRLEQYVETTQYRGRPDWFSTDRPLFERRPCIAYAIVRAAIDSNVDLCLGDNRFPSINAVRDPGGDNDAALSNDEADAVDSVIGDIIDQARVKRAVRTAMAEAQGCKSVALIAGVRGGRLFVDVEKAKWSTPTIDAYGNVTRLEIQYPYFEEYRDQRGKWKVRTKLYRRVIDELRDVTYLPADADKRGDDPAWREDPERSFPHGFGRCPVVWYAHMVGCSTASRIDGRAIHEHLLDEIQALDFSLSQRHRAALLAGDPQWTETGVDSESGPRAGGREPLWSTPEGGSPSEQNRPQGSWVAPAHAGSKPARKKGPGEIWQYPDPDVRVQLHTLPGDALNAITDHAQDLRAKIAESMAVVFTDPESLRYASALSGKAQRMLRARQLDRCDQYREDMSDGLIRPLVYLLILIAVNRAKSLRITSLRRALPALLRLVENDDLPELSLKWGKYFDPDADDAQKEVRALVEADKLIPLPDKWILRNLREQLGIENVQQALEEVEEAREMRAEQQQKAFEHSAHALGNMASGGAVGTRNRGPAGAGTPEDAGVGRDSAPPPPPRK